VPHAEAWQQLGSRIAALGKDLGVEVSV